MTNDAFPEFKLPDELLGRPVDVMVLGNSRLEMECKFPVGPPSGDKKTFVSKGRSTPPADVGPMSRVSRRAWEVEPLW